MAVTASEPVTLGAAQTGFSVFFGPEALELETVCRQTPGGFAEPSGRNPVRNLPRDESMHQLYLPEGGRGASLKGLAEGETGCRSRAPGICGSFRMGGSSCP